MANKRVFYAVQQVGFALDGTTTFTAAHGVQSIGITTNFNLEQVFEQGQLSIYQNIEQLPDVEVTLEKVLDGYPLLYHLATHGATSGTLVGRANIKTIVGLSIFSDTGTAASGTPLAEVSMSGMATSSLTYTFPVDGSATEAVTLVGNNKVWRDDETLGTSVFNGAFDDTDQPLSLTDGSGGIQQRQHILFWPTTTGGQGIDINGQTTVKATILPTDINGITSSGTNPITADGSFTVHVQNITVSADLGRDAVYELGRKSPYFRFVTFPVEVRTEIEVLATKMDNVSATEAGGQNGAPTGSNLKSQSIRVLTLDGTYLDLGTKNKLTSIVYGGGDASTGGGNVTYRYTYITYNDLTVKHPLDPSGL